MAYIVTERCVNCRYTDCCGVCPVNCFWKTEEPAMLVIDPDTCIDCALCVPACPIHAIYPEAEVPEPYKEWIEKNRELFAAGVNITTVESAMEGALTLGEIQAKEQANGWDVPEPSQA
jgi:ferredoxin